MRPPSVITSTNLKISVATLDICAILQTPLSTKNWTHQKNPALRWWDLRIPKFQWRLSNPAPFKAMHFRHELVLFLRQRPPNTSILKKPPMQSWACGTNSLPPTAGCKRAASDWPAARKDEARRIAANMAKLPELLRK